MLVEFALVLPLLLMLLIGIFEFGRALNYWIDQTHLANAAARWAAVDTNPGPGATLQESIRLQADSEELRNDETFSVCIDFPNGGSDEVGEPVEATVSVVFDWLPFLSDLTGVTETTLSGSATMRIERPPTEYEPVCGS